MEAMAVTPRFWSGQTVLVTGATGFKGAWLSLWLSQLGARVVGYSFEPHTNPSLFETLGLASLIEHHEGDVCDFEHLRTLVRSVRPALVIHLAAQALVSVGLRDPRRTYNSNLMGTVNVLEVLRDVPAVQAALVVTSDKCYRNDGQRIHTEEDALGGNDPYSDSKACAELATATMRSAFFASGDTIVATARAGNVVGGGDWADGRIVPDTVRAAFGSGSLELRYPDAVRPWQHVLEVLEGYLLLAKRALEGDVSVAGAWNFGPPATRHVPVRTLVSSLCNRLGVEIEVCLQDGARAPEVPWLVLDSTKACTRLGWSTRMSIEQVVGATADWYAAYHRGDDMTAFSRAELAAFA